MSPAAVSAFGFWAGLYALVSWSTDGNTALAMWICLPTAANAVIYLHHKRLERRRE